MILFASAIFGVLLGLLSMLPGVHVSVLLIGLLPILGLGGLSGGCALAGALGSSLIVTTLAKTFHPVNREFLDASTPEQKMAYQGNGIKAITAQVNATWTGVFTVLLVGLILAGLEALCGGTVKSLLSSIKPFGFIAIAGFLWATYYQAGKKLDTILVMVFGTLIGFTCTNHPALVGNPSVLAPLLGGVFAVPMLVLVLLEKGKSVPIPPQREPKGSIPPTGHAFYGSLGGLVTALTAGLGSGAAVSLFAGSVKEEHYLEMHTASEATNAIFALMLFLVAGVARSGSAVAMKQSIQSVDTLTIVILLFCVLGGILVATQFTFSVLGVYVSTISRIPQKGVAIVVLCFTLSMVYAETGTIGLFACLCAASLGIVARFRMVPNQALVTVLTGPVLIYYAGLANPLGQLLGLIR